MGDFTFKHVFTRANPGCIVDFYNMEKRPLGEGSYGRVVKAKRKDTEDIRAVKSMEMKKIANMERFRQEIDIQMNLDHPNIVKLYETFEDAKFIYLVLELCTGGELFDRIVEMSELHEGAAFGEREVAKYMTQIMGAVRYLHSKKYAHRDIKPENFLLQTKAKDAEIKVIDFGLATKFDEGAVMKTRAGTPYYVAPQVLTGKGYDEKCDIWSCGVICYILICGYPPFYGDRDSEILSKVKKGKFDYPSPDWDNVTKEAKDFINAMLMMDAEKRPSAEECLENPWFKIHAESKSEVKLSSQLPQQLRKFRCASKFKKVVLTMIAQNLPDSQVGELRKTFAALDKNNDGTLSFKEITDGLKQHGLECEEGLMHDLAGLDTDGSGTIDYSEFLAATLSKKQHITKELAWGAFRVFDKDGDGQITKEELHEVLKDPDFKDSAQILLEADYDKSGSISFEEFEKALGL